MRFAVIYNLLIVALSTQAISQEDYPRPTSWSYELPSSSTVAPFSRPLDVSIPNSGQTRSEATKQQSTTMDNFNDALPDMGQHQTVAQVSAATAPYLKPWPQISWSLHQPGNDNQGRVTFSDGLNTTMPWLTNQSTSDWSSRLIPSSVDSTVDNHPSISQQQLVSNQPEFQASGSPAEINSFPNQPPSQFHNQVVNKHALNYLSLLAKPTITGDPVEPVDWTRFAATNEVAQHVAIPIKGSHLLNRLDKQPVVQKMQNSHHTNKQTNTPGNSAWFKTFSPKRRSYDTISEVNQYSPRMAATSVYFDDSLETLAGRKDLDQINMDGQFKTNKDYLSTSYASLPVIYETAPMAAIERKNLKLERNHDEQLGSLIDSLASGSKYSMTAAAMPSYYATGYPAIHHLPHATHRKGLEKSLGVSILVGVGAALISFLIISNLFLSVPLFAMTLMQLLNGSPMLMPTNNNNGNNQVPNNNNQTPNGQTANNGRKRRNIQDIELEGRIQKALSDSGRY